MSIPRPSGGYVGQMLDPGGWPEVDEAMLYDRARQFARTLGEITEVLESWQTQQAQVFEGGIWTGGAADAANSEVGANIDALTTLQNGIVTAITWHNHSAGTIEHTKSAVIDNVELAYQQINAINNDLGLEPSERDTAINTVVATTYGANVTIVGAAAEQIVATTSWKPPGNALQDLLDRKAPPPYVSPDESSLPAVPSPRGQLPGEQTPAPSPAPTTPAPDPTPAPTPPPTPTPAPTPVAPGDGPSPRPPPATPPGFIVPPRTGAPPQIPSPPGSLVPPSGTPNSNVPRPRSPTDPDAPDADVLDPGAVDTPDGEIAAPRSPEAPTAPPPGADGDRGKGVAPASVTAPTVGSPSRDDAAVAPAAATGAPPASAAPAAAGGAIPAGTAGGGGSGSAAPVRSKPLGAPPTPQPAATSTQAAARAARAVPPNPPDRLQSPDVAAMAVVPVSAARAARDAIATASTADAARRRGPDPLQLARRIAAALNSPDSGGGDLGFFWITAVTSDGKIVVANSYGLGYIPDGVQLPEAVHMASSDDTIPATQRASWATYPVMAVQGWATHHDTKLRAVIATEQQLANSDPGAAKIILTPDDIPESGEMSGRSRLAVVNPEAAKQLSVTSDPDLASLLPALGTADATSPTDRRAELWFEVIKPMMSRADGRGIAHLRAFHGYAAHTQEYAAAETHAAIDPAVRRVAVAEWLYWKRVAALSGDALASGDRRPPAIR